MRREMDIFLTALMFFTRIPVPEQAGYTYHPDYLQESSRYFSLIGWIVGGRLRLELPAISTSSADWGGRFVIDGSVYPLNGGFP